MKALLLAAGEGTRLRPLTLERPKPMLPLEGRPLLAYLVDLLRRHGVREVAINLHHRPEAIVNYFGDGRNHGVSITYSYEPELLGSAGAMRPLRWFLDEPFFVLYGDVLTDLDLEALASHHHVHRAAATLAVYSVEDPGRCGVVDLADERVVRFVEKPAPGTFDGNLANAGIYVLDPSVLSFISDRGPADCGRDLFPALLAAGLPVCGYRSSAYILDIGSPERYQQAMFDLQTGRYQPPIPDTPASSESCSKLGRHGARATAGLSLSGG